MAEDTITELVDVTNTGAVIHEGMAMNPETGHAYTEDEISALPVDNSTDLADDSNSTEQVRPESIDNEDEDPNVAWARKKGIDPTDPAAIAKLAKIARDNQRDYTKDRQAETSMDSLMAGLAAPAPQYQQPWQGPSTGNQYQAPQYDQYGQPLQQYVEPQYAPQGLPTNQLNMMNMSFFRSAHAMDVPAGGDLDLEIAKVISEDPDFWMSTSVHLERALKLAKSNVSEKTIEDRLEQARREERDRLTRKSSLQSPSNQSSTQTSGGSITSVAQAEAFLATNPTASELAEKQDELERILGIELGPKKRRS